MMYTGSASFCRNREDPDPADPDRNQVQANEKVDKFNFFPEKFQNCFKNTQKYGPLFHLTLIRKIKRDFFYNSPDPLRDPETPPPTDFL